MSKILAIDPGVSGSAALFHGTEPVDVISFAHTKRWWSALSRWMWLESPDYIVKERVNGWAGQGGKSQFNFGWTDGAAFVAIDLFHKPVELVEATWWQRRIGLPHHYEAKTRDQARRLSKKDQKEFCLQRWPWLKEWDEVRDTENGGRARPDIWQSVCIGYAKALDLAGVPLGQT